MVLEVAFKSKFGHNILVDGCLFRTQYGQTSAKKTLDVFCVFYTIENFFLRKLAEDSRNKKTLIHSADSANNLRKLGVSNPQKIEPKWYEVVF